MLVSLIGAVNSYGAPEYRTVNPDVGYLLVSSRMLADKDPEQSLQHMQSALDTAIANDNVSDEIFTLYSYGKALSAQGKHGSARQYYESAISRYQQDLTTANSRVAKNFVLTYFVSAAFDLLGRPAEAQDYLERSIDVAIAEDAKIYLLEAYEFLATLCYQQKKYKDTIDVSEKLLNVAQLRGEIEYQIKAERRAAEAYKKLQNYNRVFEHNKRALALAEQGGEKPIIARYLGYVADSQKTLGYYSDALRSAQKALAMQRELNDVKRMAGLGLNISIIYLKLSLYDQAFSYALDALSYYEHETDLNGIAAGCNQIARIYSRLKDFKDANRFYQRTLDLGENTVNLYYRAAALRGLSGSARSLNNFPRALDLAQQSYQIYERLNDYKGMASVDRAFGDIYRDMGQKKRAITFHEKAIKVASRVGARWSETSSRIHIGSILVGSEPKKARSSLQVGLKIAQQLEAKSLMLDAYRGLIVLEREAGNYKKALSYSDKSYHLVKEIINDDLVNKISELQVIQKTKNKQEEIDRLEKSKLQNERDLQRQSIELEMLNREKRIADLEVKHARFVHLFFIGSTIIFCLILMVVFTRYYYLRKSQQALNERNAKIEKMNTDLSSLNKTKDRFFSIISHDLRSPVSSIVVVADMLYESFDSIAPAKIKEYIYDIYQSSEQTYGLLENLLSWSVIQMRDSDPQPKKCNAYELCIEALNPLQASINGKHIRLDISVDHDHCIYADKNMVVTVIRNIVSNAIKFTPQGGDIELRSQIYLERALIHIIDSGVGMSELDQENLFSMEFLETKRGTDGEGGSGFGLSLCQQLMAKNKGKITVQSILGKGSEFTITLPAKPPLSTSSLAATKA